MGKLKAFEVQTKMEDEEDNPQRAIVEVKNYEKKIIKEEKNLAFKSSKFGKQAKILMIQKSRATRRLRS